MSFISPTGSVSWQWNSQIQGVSSTPFPGGQVLLTFEEGTPFSFYAASYGVSFVNADLLTSPPAVFSFPPSATHVIGYLSTGSMIMNVANGFEGVEIFYTTVSNSTSTWSVYSGLNGTGTLIDGGVFPGRGAIPAPYGNWGTITSFPPAAKSIVFAGAQNQILFDNITLFILPP